MKKTILLFAVAVVSLLTSCGSSITPPSVGGPTGNKYYLKPGDTIVTYTGLVYFAQGSYKCSYIATKDPQQPYIITVTVKSEGSKN